METRKWTEPYQVYWHDTDLKGEMNFAAISRYLQDVAWKSAESLNFGFTKVAELNLHWVLVRQLIKMKRLPKWEEKIKIETWPRGLEGIWAYRDYQIKSENGEVLGGVSSAWMVIDTITRRPQKLEIMKDVLPGTFLDSVIGDSASKILFNGEEKLIDKRQARYSDMDINGHVNNSKYVDWMMDALSQSDKLGEYLNFHINYISEVKSNEEIKLFMSEKPGTTLVKATNQIDKTIFIAELF